MLLKKLPFIIVPLIFLLAFSMKEAGISADKAEAKKAFEYLNQIRAKPDSFSLEIGANLKNVAPVPRLKWNDMLAKVAEEKALDMAKRNYFSHLTPEGKGINVMINGAGYKLNKDWIKAKSENSFESIQAGAKDGKEAIKLLIIDSYDKELGHRKHLLGMNEWNKDLKDIGIGFVHSPNSKYKTYVSIIIAKHDWEQ